VLQLLQTLASRSTGSRSHHLPAVVRRAKNPRTPGDPEPVTTLYFLFYQYVNQAEALTAVMASRHASGDDRDHGRHLQREARIHENDGCLLTDPGSTATPGCITTPAATDNPHCCSGCKESARLSAIPRCITLPPHSAEQSFTCTPHPIRRRSITPA